MDELTNNLQYDSCVDEHLQDQVNTWGGGGGGGGYLTKFNTGRLCPKVQPLTLLYTILAEKVPLLYTFY